MNVRALARWRWWIAAAAAVAGLLVGLLIAFTVSTDRRAEAAVRISGPGVDGLMPELRQLATSSVLAGNVASTLRLHESPDHVRDRLSASVRAHTTLLAIRATASNADRARQLAQEAAVVFTQIAPQRFPNVKAQLFDAAHGIGGGDRHLLRDSALGLLVGLCLGLLAAALLGGGGVPVATAAPRDLEEREQLLARRIELVSRREAAVARRVGELAARERQLEDQHRPTEPAGSPQPPPQPVAAPAPASGWTIDELEHFVASNAEAHPGRVDEWRTYVFFLRDYAEPDGRIPGTFDALIDDVFVKSISVS